MKQTRVTEMSHPKWLLGAVFLLCAAASLFCIWARVNMERLFVQIEEQIRGALGPSVLVAAVAFGLLAVFALFCLLGLSVKTGLRIFGVLAAVLAVAGVKYSAGLIFDRQSILNIPAYLGGKESFSSVWYGLVPAALAVLSLGFGFGLSTKKICFLEGILFLAAGIAGALYAYKLRNYMVVWNVCLPWPFCIAFFHGALGGTVKKVLTVQIVVLSLLALWGLWYVFQSGGRENASSYVVIPAAMALGIFVIRTSNCSG